MSIRILDEGAFLRVVNTRYGTEAFLNKNTVLVQKNSSNSFMLKDGGFASSYAFADVLEPALGTLDEVIDDILIKVENSRPNAPAIPAASTDVTGVVRLVDSFSNTSLTLAPTADALRRSHALLDSQIAGLENDVNSAQTLVVSDQLAVGTSNFDGALHVAGDLTVSGGGQFRGDAGADSVTAPAYAWNADANTGMYNVQNNVIGFAAAGSQVAQLGRDRLYVAGDVSTSNALFASNVEVIDTLTAGGNITAPNLNVPASTDTSGIVMLVDGYSNFSLSNAPTVAALSRSHSNLSAQISSGGGGSNSVTLTVSSNLVVGDASNISNITYQVEVEQSVRAGSNVIAEQFYIENADGSLTLLTPGGGSGGGGVPVGTVETVAPPTLPPGYVYCDGRELSRTDYAELFDAIGTKYGSGDGSTTFNVPSLAPARVVRTQRIQNPYVVAASESLVEKIAPDLSSQLATLSVADKLTYAAFGIDGSFYYGTDQSELYRLNTEPMELEGVFTRYANKGTAVDYSGGIDVFTADENNRLWKVDPVRMYDEQYIIAVERPLVLAVSRDGKIVFAGLDDGSVRQYLTTSLFEQQAFTGHNNRVYALTTDADSTYLFTASEDSTVRKVRVSDMTEVASYNTGAKNTAIDYGGDGRVYAGTDQGDVFQLAETDLSLVASYTQHTGRINAIDWVDISPPRLYTGSGDGTVHWIDPSDMTQVATYTAAGGVLAMGYSPVFQETFIEVPKAIKATTPTLVSDAYIEYLTVSCNLAVDGTLSGSFDVVDVRGSLQARSNLIADAYWIEQDDGALVPLENTLIGSNVGVGGVPVGTVETLATASNADVPTNYVPADGRALSRMEYSELFAALGTRYGEGDGSTTFNLPAVKPVTVTRTRDVADRDLFAATAGVVRRLQPDLSAVVAEFDSGGTAIRRVVLGGDGFLYVGDGNSDLYKVDADAMERIGTYDGHNAGLNDVSFPLGSDFVYSAANEGFVHKVNPRTMVRDNILDTAGGRIPTALAFDGAGGEFAYVAFDDQTVAKIDVTYMAVRREYGAHAATVAAVLVGGDGYVYSCDGNGEVHKVDPADMTQVTVYASGNAANALAWGDDSRVYVATGSDVHQLDASGVGLGFLQAYTDHTDTVNAVTFAEGTLFTASSDTEVHAVDPADMATRIATYTGFGTAVTNLAFSRPTYEEVIEVRAYVKARGPAFLAGGGAPAGTVVTLARDQSGDSNLVAPSGFLLADGREVSRAKYATLFGAVGTYYGAGDGSTTFNLPNVDREALQDVTARVLYTASDDTSVLRVDPSDMTQVDSYTGHPNAVRVVVARTVGGRQVDVFSTGGSADIRRLDPSTLALRGTYEPGNTDAFWALTTDGDAGHVYGGNAVGVLHKVTVSDMTQAATAALHTDRITSLACDATGGLLYSGSWDNAVVKSATSDLAAQNSFANPGGSVWAVALNADGIYLYVGDGNGVVRKLSTSDMSEQATFTGHTDRVETLTVGSDGNVYSGALDTTVRKIDPSTMSELAQYTGIGQRVQAVAHAADGYVYAAGENNEVHKLNASDLTFVSAFTGHTDDVTSLALADNAVVSQTAVPLLPVVAYVNGGGAALTADANKVLVGNGSNDVLTPAALHWDDANAYLGVGTDAPAARLHVDGEVRIDGELTGSFYPAAGDGGAFVPVATVLTSASSNVPAGFLRPDGAEVSRTTYSALFGAIGTTFGPGDGSTTFNIPKFRNESVTTTLGEDLYAGFDGGEIHRIDTRDLSQVYVYGEHTAAVNALARPADGLLLSASDDATIHKIDISGLTTMAKAGEFAGHSTGVKDLAYDGADHVYSVTSGGELRKIRVSDMTSVASRTLSVALTSVVFAVDTVFVGGDTTIEQVDPDSLATVASDTTEHGNTVTDLEYDRGFVFSACADNVVRKWNTDGLALDRKRAYGTPLRSLAIGAGAGADHRFLYVGSDDTNVRRVDPTTLGLVDVYDNPASAVRSLAWALDVYAGSSGRIDKVNGTTYDLEGTYTQNSSNCLALSARTVRNTAYKLIAF